MSKLSKILLGYEVVTCKPVYLDPDHLIITGQTQMAGKTVTLNALNSRSGRRCIAFRTKRGEMEFEVVKTLKPFYTEPKTQRSKYISWQYVKSILEASQGRGMTFEEAWIIRACDNARTLREVYENIKRLQDEARKGIDENQYLKLTAYFDIILPQLEEREYSKTIKLKKGINVMDLEPLSFEMRCLVMERTITYVMEKMKNVVIMLPEGWKYVPEKLKTPVKSAAIGLAREGASIQVHIWIDSQDIRGVDKVLVGQCSTWLLGVQVEENEAKRTRTSLGNRVKVRDIQNLKLGHFYLRNKKNELKHVYVLPAGVPETMGKQVANGEILPEVVRDYLMGKKLGDDEEMYQKKFEEAVETIGKLEDEIQELQDEKGDVVGLRLDLEKERNKVKEIGLKVSSLESEKDAMENLFKDRGLQIDKLNKKIDEMEKEAQRANRFVMAIEDYIQDTVGEAMKSVEAARPAPSESVDVSLTHESPSLEVTILRKRFTADTSKTRGQLLYLYSIGAFGDAQFSVAKANTLLQENGWNKSPRTKQYLDDMMKWGFLERLPAGRRYDYRVKMTPEEAKERDLLKVEEKVIE
jgi:predicted nuclease with TOPRIM domain